MGAHLGPRLSGNIAYIPLIRDSFFKAVTLLLNGDGTNAAQNNTFIDSSTNNFTVTRNGNTTQGTNTPFSQADGSWSNYFNGTSDYLSSPANTATTIGTGDFTFEAWIYSNNFTTTYAPIFTQYDNSTNGGLWIGKNGSNFVLRAAGVADQLQYATMPTTNTWTHIAITRSGSTVTLFYNGISVATATSSYNFINVKNNIGSDGATSASYFTGYISNLRLVKGTVVYTANFTPPTTPLTAITNTSLLTCQSNYFKDNSSNNFTLTVTGTPSVQPFSPFAPTSAYSTSVNGGSMYFDGSGDNVYVSSISLPSDFTLECWIYTLSTADQVVSSGGGNANHQLFRLNYPSSGFLSYFLGTAPVYDSGTACIFPNQWTHLALSRTGSTCNLYVNGVLFNTNTTTGSFTFGNVGCLFSTSSIYYFTGYISNYRCIAGTGLYPSAFTPPTAPLTAITNTQLLLNGTNAGIYDNAIKNDLETVGNAQVSTSVKKYGTGSMYFDGTGDYLKFPSSANLTLGSGDWTIEFWAYLNSVSGQPFFFDQRTTDPEYTPCLYSSGTSNGIFSFYVNGADRITASTALTTGQWYHIALCRSSGNTKLFYNGTQTGSTYVDSGTYLSGQFVIGSRSRTFDYNLNAYIDDFRITKGIARYTANFTPPTESFPIL